MKKTILRFAIRWSVSGLLLLPVGGCFSAMSRFMGHSPSTDEAIWCAALDVVTMPAQVVVFGPLLAKECIDANTGERGKVKRRREEVGRHKQELTADFSKVYSDAAFLSATNTPQREALSEWLGYYNVNHPERELIDPLVERLVNDYDAAYALRSILGQKNLSADLKKRLCVSLVEGSRTRTMDRQSDVVDMMLYGNHLSENELKSLISGKGDSTDKAIEKCIRRREEAREKKRKCEEDYAARVRAETAKWDAERRRREEELQRARERHYKEMEEVAKGLKGSVEEFRKALAVRNEFAVRRVWTEMLNRRCDSLPAENVRMLAETVTEPGEEGRSYLRYLFLRPELTGDDLRRLYPRVLAKLREPGGWQKEGLRYVGALIRNENFPLDLARASYKEPILSEFRIRYADRHKFDDAMPRSEIPKFERKCHALKRDIADGKISGDAINVRKFELTKKYLPAECPDDWVKSIP